ncbi:hypothetical protein HPULCUR_007730 [Helicostylum pulchrum]|uniref:Uncharacterized protein n=1 Tax=Helicostylum pulchrum TaxID=562976 RepID=A0ABP9Y7H6_9FUNG
MYFITTSCEDWSLLDFLDSFKAENGDDDESEALRCWENSLALIAESDNFVPFARSTAKEYLVGLKYQ